MADVALQVLDAQSNSLQMAQEANTAGQRAARVSLGSSMPTYRSSQSFTPYATAALTVASIVGAAGKTVRIKRIWIEGVSTAAGSCPYQLQRTSALGTGGTASVAAPAKNDLGVSSSTPAAVCPGFTGYTTAAQSKGTAVGGVLSTKRVFTGIVTSPTTGPVTGTMFFPEGGAPIGQEIVLRGAADFLEIQNSNGGNLPAGTVLDVTFEWTEDNS